MTENFVPKIPKNNHKEDALHPPLGSFSSNTGVNIVCKMILQSQIFEIQTYTPIALDGSDIEGIHKMRVGFRRLRTGLKIFKPIIKKKTYQYFQTNLRNASQIFGKIRDLDVLHEDMIAFQVEHRDLSIEKFWRQNFSPLYNQYRNELISLISSNQYKMLFSYLKAFCREENAGIKSTKKLPTEACSIKEFSLSRVTNFMEILLSYSDLFKSPQPYQVYHQLRKDAKKMRYGLEFFTPILKPAETENLIQNMVILQDHLGLLNDTVVASEIYNSLVLAPESATESDSNHAIAEYFESRKLERMMLTEKFKETWNTFTNTSPELLV